VKVRHNEGVATHVGPEPCVVAREGTGEASVGGRVGQPLSRERRFFPGADVVSQTEGSTDGRVIAGRSGVVLDTGMCERSFFGKREVSRSAIGESRWLASGRREAVADDART
jgi:hypothetical protein